MHILIAFKNNTWNPMGVQSRFSRVSFFFCFFSIIDFCRVCPGDMGLRSPDKVLSWCILETVFSHRTKGTWPTVNSECQMPRGGGLKFRVDQ